MRRQPWTAEELKILKEGLEMGLTPRDLTQVLKSRSINAIENKARLDLGWKYPVIVEIDWDCWNEIKKIHQS